MKQEGIEGIWGRNKAARETAAPPTPEWGDVEHAGDNPSSQHIAMQKGMPANIDAECFLLGSILLDDSRFPEIAASIVAEDYALEKHRRIYSRMLDIQDRGERVDRVSLANELLKFGELESCDGLGYLVSLDDGMPHIPNLEGYVRILKEKSSLRQIAISAQHTLNRAIMGEEDPADILSSLESSILQMSDRRATKKGLTTPLEAIQSHEGGLNSFLDPSRRSQGLMTGFVKLDEMTGGMRPGELIILAARPSMGKAQPLGSPVKVPGGWQAIGNLRRGDALCSIDGAQSIVEDVFPQGELETFNVEFSDGRVTQCCANHLWTVCHRKWATPKVMTTKAVALMLQVPVNRHRLYIPVIDGDLSDTPQELPLSPWLMGYLLGNGGFTGVGVKVSIPDLVTVSRVNSELAAVGCVAKKESEAPSSIDYRIVKRQRDNGQTYVKIAIKSLGLDGCSSTTKFIPQAYLNAPKCDREELLRGLLDSDGTSEKFSAVTFSSSSESLSADVRYLIRSLGGIATRRSRIPDYTYKGERLKGQRSYCVGVMGLNPDQCFWLPRKLERAAARTSRKNRLSFVSITPAGKQECVCISVSHPTQTYITNDFIVTHNTALAMNIAWNVSTTLAEPVAIFSLEMSIDSLLTRMLCSSARIDQHRFRTGYLSAAERVKLREAANAMVEAPIGIDDTSGVHLMDMHAKLRRMKQEKGRIGLVVVDYLQLMSGKGKQESRNQEVSQISRGLKLMAKEMDCPFLVLSQLSRAAETRSGDHRPQLSDLRESGSIEQDADVVSFVFRPEVYKRDREDLRGVAELIVAKQRNGPIGVVPLVFLHAQTRFDNRADSPEPETMFAGGE